MLNRKKIIDLLVIFGSVALLLQKDSNLYRDSWCDAW
jgi:hypothetical protein